MAKIYGKKPSHWLELTSTASFLNTLGAMGKSHSIDNLVVTQSDGIGKRVEGAGSNPALITQTSKLYNLNYITMTTKNLLRAHGVNTRNEYDKDDLIRAVVFKTSKGERRISLPFPAASTFDALDSAVAEIITTSI
jgi:hypothetical protein